jgi:hypothetical protein
MQTEKRVSGTQKGDANRTEHQQAKQTIRSVSRAQKDNANRKKSQRGAEGQCEQKEESTGSRSVSSWAKLAAIQMCGYTKEWDSFPRTIVNSMGSPET